MICDGSILPAVLSCPGITPTDNLQQLEDKVSSDSSSEPVKTWATHRFVCIFFCFTKKLTNFVFIHYNLQSTSCKAILKTTANPLFINQRTFHMNPQYWGQRVFFPFPSPFSVLCLLLCALADVPSQKNTSYLREQLIVQNKFFPCHFRLSLWGVQADTFPLIIPNPSEVQISVRSSG